MYSHIHLVYEPYVLSIFFLLLFIILLAYLTNTYLVLTMYQVNSKCFINIDSFTPH